MAEGRVVKKYISTSETVNNLDFPAMVLYTWSIAHADDAGLIPSSPKKIKAQIAPMWDMALDPFGIQLESIQKALLWWPVIIENEPFFYVVGHNREQVLKRDRKPKSICLALTDWIHLESIWNQLESEMKRKEMKRNETKPDPIILQPTAAAIDSTFLKNQARGLGGQK